MNRSHLIPACLLGFGALAVLSAQEGKVNLPGQQGASAPAAPAVSASAPAVPAPAFTEPQILEAFGWFVGKRLGLFELAFTNEQTNALVKGLVAAAAGKEAPYDLVKIEPEMDAYMQKKQEVFVAKLRDQNLGEARAFFEKLKANKNVVELPDGLCYEVIKPGTGAYPKATDTLKVHYTGTLLNGTVFESSVQSGQPFEFALNQMIPGWTEGLQKINQGGKIRLYIPPQLAYGDAGQQGIPPGAALIFDIELLEVKASTPAAAPETKP